MGLALKSILFTVLIPGTAAVYVPLLAVRGRAAAGGVSMVLGASMVAIGVSIYLWCVWDFATFGRGTPAPIDAPKKLVVRGLYRFTRNPMYVGRADHDCRLGGALPNALRCCRTRSSSGSASTPSSSATKSRT